jgi:hypothetical protein
MAGVTTRTGGGTTTTDTAIIGMVAGAITEIAEARSHRATCARISALCGGGQGTVHAAQRRLSAPAVAGRATDALPRQLWALDRLPQAGELMAATRVSVFAVTPVLAS